MTNKSHPLRLAGLRYLPILFMVLRSLEYRVSDNSATKTPNICVYCGSSPGNDPAFIEAAEQVGRLIAARGCRLVYGAGDLGLMGASARAARDAGGEVIGVIPHHLHDKEREAHGLTALIRTETMHERKKVMFATSDAFLVLPGGPGTLDETIETLTWHQLELHAKPLCLVNIKGYWDPFVSLLTHFSDNGFMNARFHDFYDVEASPESALDAMLDRLVV